MTKTSHLDIVSATWILASNDENPLITYKSVIHRLGLEENFDIKGLIKVHGELFRQKASDKALTEWKNQMSSGKHLPSWVKSLSESEKQKAINALTTDDIFRSQFRAKSSAPASDISIINWGLEHIERTRKVSTEQNHEKYKKLTMFWIPILTTTISILTVLTSYYNQQKLLDSQTSIKKMELEYKTKQDGYTNFMKNVISAYTTASQNNKNDLIKSLDNIETNYYSFESLLNDKDKNEIWKNYQEFSEFCYSAIEKKQNDTIYADKCLKYKNIFRKKLQYSLNQKK